MKMMELVIGGSINLNTHLSPAFLCVSDAYLPTLVSCQSMRLSAESRARHTTCCRTEPICTAFHAMRCSYLCRGTIWFCSCVGRSSYAPRPPRPFGIRGSAPGKPLIRRRRPERFAHPTCSPPYRRSLFWVERWRVTTGWPRVAYNSMRVSTSAKPCATSHAASLFSRVSHHGLWLPPPGATICPKQLTLRRLCFHPACPYNMPR
ncbi:hypothetical protein LZ31DRAFT_12774 [Colletotrichum somersetense]|nr:hypothetical protein LZ31DRAFT_12774 [Colletotrichum somersetense]